VREMGDNSNLFHKENEKNETARLMLQIYHDRSNQLVNILNAFNGFMLAFIGGLLAFVGSSAFSNSECKNVSSDSLISSGCLNPWPLFIAINIAIIVLILWRFYAHYIDDDIIRMYSKILSCENNVDVDFDASLLKSLIIQYGIEDEFQKFRQDKEFRKRKYLEIFNRIENDDVPERGHRILDWLAYISCSVLCILEFSLIKTSTNDYFIIGIFTLFLILIAFGILFQNFVKWF